MWIDIWVFDSIPLALLSVFIPIPGCFHHFSYIEEFEVQDSDTSRSSFVYMIDLALLVFFVCLFVLFCFYRMKLSIVLGKVFF